MKKHIYINDIAYSIDSKDFFKLESVQYEMQELINQDKFNSDEYKNLRTLFATFLKNGMEKNPVLDEKVKSEIFYYTN